MAVVLSLTLSIAIGFALGVFGGGGSILALPMLVFVMGVAPATGVTMSLAIVGATSLLVGYAYYRRGLVRPKVALLFGSAGIPTAWLGAQLTHLVPGNVLMFCFATLMILVGGWMLLTTRRAQTTEQRNQCGQVRGLRPMHAALASAAVGGLTGFLGVGGGFLVVPALIAFAGLGMREAVGTGLLVIAINSATGFAGHLGDHGIDLGLTASLTALAVIGGIIGERVARSLSVAKLRRGFAFFVIAVGVAVAGSAARSGGVTDAHVARISQTRHESPSDIAREIGERLARAAQKLAA